MKNYFIDDHIVLRERDNVNSSSFFKHYKSRKIVRIRSIRKWRLSILNLEKKLIQCIYNSIFITRKQVYEFLVLRLKIERISTGIPKLDELLQGGIPKGFLVTVTGEPGTGKTILCLHFVQEGLKEEEPAIYVTTEESRESLIRQAAQFGWDFYEPMTRGDLIIIDALMRETKSEWTLRRLTVEELIGIIIKAKQQFGYGHARLVIDSMSAFWLDKPAMARKYSYQVKRTLSKWNFTILMTSQYAITTSDAFGFGVEHVADGIIRFRRFIRGGELKRFLIIEKMRQTNHDLRMWEIRIVEGEGLKLIKPIEMRREDVSLPYHVMKKIMEAKEMKEKEL